MAIDEREYAQERQGWNIENLTGFRRTAKQIDYTQYDDLIERSAQYETRLRLFAFAATLLTALFVWRYFFA